MVTGSTEYEALLRNVKVPVWVLYVELATCTSQLGNVNFWIWQNGLEKQVKWTWQKYPGSEFHTSTLGLKFGVEDHAEDPLHFERMLISKAPSKFAYTAFDRFNHWIHLYRTRTIVLY